MKIIAALALALILTPPALASYTGDRLETYQHGKGEPVFTIGNSTYSGELAPGDSYTVKFTLPREGEIKLARLYLYWTWSHQGDQGVNPSMETTFQGKLLTPERKYTDQKGEDPYNYPSGTYAYNVTGLVTKKDCTAMVKNTGQGNFAINGMGLLLVYQGDTEYWLAEGADMIYAFQGIKNTTTEIRFNNIPDKAEKATLTTVVAGGNKGKNTLYFNKKTWNQVYQGKPYPDLAIDTRDVKPYLKKGENIIRIKDNGDYMVVSNAFLTVKHTSPSKTPGFTAPLTILALILLSLRRHRR